MDSLEKPVNGSSLMSLRGLGIGFGKRKLLCDVDTSFGASSLTALLGRNGSGKSTLLRAMAGLGRYDGSISVAGHDIAMLSAARRARLMAFVSTERTRIGAMSCFDIVAMGRAPHTNWIGRLCDADIAAVESALEAVGMSSFAELAHSHGKCIVFSTHELDIAVNLADDIALIDTPHLLHMPVCDMLEAGHIARVFNAAGKIPSELFGM